MSAPSSPSSSSCSSSSSPSSPPPKRSPSPETEPSDDEEFTPASPEVVAAYDSLMASLMPVPAVLPAVPVAATAPPSKPADAAETAAADAEAMAAAEAALGRPMTKGEKQNAKKKRRKERERALQAEVAAVRAAAESVVETTTDKPVVFPLFAAPTPVSLSTAESYALTTNPRLAPLPATVTERISRLAAEAAVDAPDIAVAYPSRMPEKVVREYTLQPGQDLRCKYEKGKGRKAREGMPAMFVLAVDPHAPVKCPVVAVPLLKPTQDEDEEEPQEAPRKRRRFRGVYREFPPAQYWEPEAGAEGRSAAYFYGWSV